MYFIHVPNIVVDHYYRAITPCVKCIHKRDSAWSVYFRLWTEKERCTPVFSQ